MICPKCGKEFKGLCLNCTDPNELVWIPDLVVTLCPKCGRYKVEGRWKSIKLEDAIELLIFKSIRVHPELDVEKIVVEQEPFTVKIVGSVSGTRVEIVKHPKLKIVKETCLRCSRESGGYYESILQLRADNRKLKKEEIEKANKVVNEVLHTELDNQKAFITKVIERKEGIDFFFGGRDIGRKISRKLAVEFGAEVKESKTISGRADGRDLYRFTYLVRLPFYKNGDVVEEDGKICIITNAKLKKAVNIRDMNKIPLKDPKLIARWEEIKRGVVVQKDESVVELIELETNNVVFAEKTCEVDIGEEVFVLNYDNKFYIIPKELTPNIKNESGKST